jgi:hypothetical protein
MGAGWGSRLTANSVFVAGPPPGSLRDPTLGSWPEGRLSPLQGEVWLRTWWFLARQGPRQCSRVGKIAQRRAIIVAVPGNFTHPTLAYSAKTYSMEAVEVFLSSGESCQTAAGCLEPISTAMYCLPLTE